MKPAVAQPQVHIREMVNARFDLYFAQLSQDRWIFRLDIDTPLAGPG